MRRDSDLITDSAATEHKIDPLAPLDTANSALARVPMASVFTSPPRWQQDRKNTGAIQHRRDRYFTSFVCLTQA